MSTPEPTPDELAKRIAVAEEANQQAMDYRAINPLAFVVEPTNVIVQIGNVDHRLWRGSNSSGQRVILYVRVVSTADTDLQAICEQFLRCEYPFGSQPKPITFDLRHF